jgi:hypothetical protein
VAGALWLTDGDGNSFYYGHLAGYSRWVLTHPNVRAGPGGRVPGPDEETPSRRRPTSTSRSIRRRCSASGTTVLSIPPPT